MPELYWPFSTALVSEWPGQRVGSYHVGTDFAVPVGTTVRATSSGTIVFVGDDGLGGMTIDLRRDDGLIQRFGHLSKYLVSVGQRVEAGQDIALSGNTGRSTGPHLHWELRWDRLWNGGNWVDPRTLSPATFGGNTASTPPTTTTDEEEDEMLQSFRNTGTQAIVIADLRTGFWWQIPDKPHYDLMVARQLCKAFVNLEPHEWGLLHVILDAARANVQGGAAATVDTAALQATITDALKGFDVNVDGLAAAIATKLNTGTPGVDETTKAEILAAIEANYPEEASA